jgi:hypothetical protein
VRAHKISSAMRSLMSLAVRPHLLGVSRPCRSSGTCQGVVRRCVSPHDVVIVTACSGVACAPAVPRKHHAGRLPRARR